MGPSSQIPTLLPLIVYTLGRLPKVSHPDRFSILDHFSQDVELKTALRELIRFLQARGRLLLTLVTDR